LKYVKIFQKFLNYVKKEKYSMNIDMELFGGTGGKEG
jgi:hypothetical protein